MKVDNGNPAVNAYLRTSIQGSAPTRPQERVDRPSEQAKPASTQATNVSISEQGRALAAGSANVDQAKVEAIKAKIANGSMQFSSQTIASRMLDVEG